MSEPLYIKEIGSGRNLVLLHGWGLHSGLFEDIAETLSADFCCHLIDLPGFGHSDDLSGDYTLVTVAEHIARYIPDNSIVLGWSMGGLVAQQLAVSHPAKVEELILVASSPCMVADGGWPHGIKPDVLQDFAEQLANDYEQTLMRFMALQSQGSDSARQDIRLLRERVFKHGVPQKRALQAGLSILQTTDLRLAFSELKIPVTVILGKLDMLVPVSVGDEMKKMSLQSHVRVLKGAGHAPFVSHPEKFMVVIRDCINV
ncbi:MAG: pimeloyl-ACP methyl ester esterase BioH [Gammaproteobacteria bacterium]|nr:pimeloyl-ACP methyl ester esterase BioH [Gammaproteobacteria bacterium]